MCKMRIFLIIFMIGLSFAGCSSTRNSRSLNDETQSSMASAPYASGDGKEDLIGDQKEEESIDGGTEVFDLPDEQLDEISEIALEDTQVFDELVRIGYTEENAAGIAEVLRTIGVDSFVVYADPETNPNEGLCPVVVYPNGYTDRDRRCFFTTEDGVVFYAAFGSEVLYDSELGGFLMDYSDVYVPETEVTLDVANQLQQLAQEHVKLNLNYPNSANFGYLDWAFGREDNRYMVVGSVTAQNALGVEDDIRFTVWFVEQNGVYVVEGVAFNGIRVQ